jgi:hypothetical protein
MKNKLVIFFLVFVLISVFIIPAGISSAETHTTIFITAGLNEAAIDEEFDIFIEAENVFGLHAFEVILSYDEDELSLVNIKTAVEGYEVGPIENEGIITYAFTKIGDSEGETGNIELCSFIVKGIKAGDTKVVLDSIKMLDSNLNEIQHSINDGEVNISVQQANPTPVPAEEPDEESSYDPTPTPTAEPKIISNCDGSIKVEIKPVMKETTGKALVEIDLKVMNEARNKGVKNDDGVKKISFEAEEVDNAKGYEISIPAEAVSEEAREMH